MAPFRRYGETAERMSAEDLEQGKQWLDNTFHLIRQVFTFLDIFIFYYEIMSLGLPFWYMVEWERDDVPFYLKHFCASYM